MEIKKVILSSRKVDTGVYKYWQKRVAEIQKSNPFFNKDKRQLLQDVMKVTHSKEHDVFVFWISPDGRVVESPGAHKEKPIYMMTPEEYEESKSRNYLRGRVAQLLDGQQVVLIYMDPQNILAQKRSLRQLQMGLGDFPIPIDDEAIIVGNGEILETTIQRNPMCFSHRMNLKEEDNG